MLSQKIDTEQCLTKYNIKPAFLFHMIKLITLPVTMIAVDVKTFTIRIFFKLSSHDCLIIPATVTVFMAIIA